MFKNIIIAFVTPTIKTKPFFVGMALAEKFDGTITVIECMYKKPPKFVFFETKQDKRASEEKTKKMKESLKKFVKVANEVKIPIKTKVALTDHISEWIIDYVHSHRTDLLIIDHPHLSEFEEKHYDEIIETINHKVKVPILLLRS